MPKTTKKQKIITNRTVAKKTIPKKVNKVAKATPIKHQAVRVTSKKAAILFCGITTIIILLIIILFNLSINSDMFGLTQTSRAVLGSNSTDASSGGGMNGGGGSSWGPVSYMPVLGFDSGKGTIASPYKLELGLNDYLIYENSYITSWTSFSPSVVEVQDTAYTSNHHRVARVFAISSGTALIRANAGLFNSKWFSVKAFVGTDKINSAPVNGYDTARSETIRGSSIKVEKGCTAKPNNTVDAFKAFLKNSTYVPSYLLTPKKEIRFLLGSSINTLGLTFSPKVVVVACDKGTNYGFIIHELSHAFDLSYNKADKSELEISWQDDMFGLFLIYKDKPVFKGTHDTRAEFFATAYTAYHNKCIINLNDSGINSSLAIPSDITTVLNKYTGNSC